MVIYANGVKVRRIERQVKMDFGWIWKVLRFAKPKTARATTVNVEEPGSRLESSNRSAGDFVGVFEYDGETSYFCLYNEIEKKILGAIPIKVEHPNVLRAQIDVRWDTSEKMVAVYIDESMCALFKVGNEISFENNAATLANMDFRQRKILN